MLDTLFIDDLIDTLFLNYYIFITAYKIYISWFRIKDNA